MVVVVSQFNGTSTPKGSYSAKTGDNDFNVNSSRYMGTQGKTKSDVSHSINYLDPCGALKGSLFHKVSLVIKPTVS